MDITENKSYVYCDISEDTSIFDTMYYEDYEISPDIITRLSKDLGFSYDLYKTLNTIDPSAASKLISTMSKKSNVTNVCLLLDDGDKSIVGYSLEDRSPILNSDFIKRVRSTVEAYDYLEVVDLYYFPKDTKSSLIIKKKDPIIIEEKYKDRESRFIEYTIGTLLINDENSSVSSRLVLYVNNQPLYLPASYYNATTSRFKRSTTNSSEALELLLLRIVDDLRDDSMQSKIYDLHFRYRANKSIATSYEEYNTILRTLRKVPTIIEDNSILESLLSRYENFERKYSRLDDQKSSYIWRCTAVSDITIDALISLTTDILNELCAPSVEYYNVRDLLGSYISTNRIVAEIAREDID